MIISNFIIFMGETLKFQTIPKASIFSTTLQPSAIEIFKLFFTILIVLYVQKITLPTFNQNFLSFSFLFFYSTSSFYIIHIHKFNYLYDKYQKTASSVPFATVLNLFTRITSSRLILM